ncbi:hypothetical protein SDC9_75718 [bioreactor metagenome]|uniref:GGDEF domain-containing protein n=1 Tax=bioreactor metagenome TaxID=1076179 RepID=A0A644YMG0_9ZZZZ
MKRKNTLLITSIAGAMCLLMMVFFLYSLDRVRNIYVEETTTAVYDLNKNYLWNTVNNLILEIDGKREKRAAYAERLVSRTATVIELKAELSEAEFEAFVREFFQGNSDYASVCVVLWSDAREEAVYDPCGLGGASWEATVSAALPKLSAYRILTHGNARLLLGVATARLDAQVKEEIADTIRSLMFQDGSYLWVNEILNYEGGADYAIRRVHPNLPGTEGTYLSTDATDVAGNHPYQTELDGINRDGELFFTYYFKELNSERVSPKLAYAKLYRDYNWVIAMGTYQNELQGYIDQANEKSNALASRLILVLALTFASILALSFTVIVGVEKSHNRKSRKAMESEINQDSLTKADSRRRGVRDLGLAFEDFVKSGLSPGIMMVDIDQFKGINDRYGHDVGDRVLIEVTRAIQGMIRTSDRVIRWGGDEFIVLFYGMRKKNALMFADRALSAVSALKIPVSDGELTVGISIGFSFFRREDANYTEALKRADQALYQSKTQGRHQAHLID